MGVSQPDWEMDVRLVRSADEGQRRKDKEREDLKENKEEEKEKEWSSVNGSHQCRTNAGYIVLGFAAGAASEWEAEPNNDCEPASNQPQTTADFEEVH